MNFADIYGSVHTNDQLLFIPAYIGANLTVVFILSRPQGGGRWAVGGKRGLPNTQAP